MPGVNTICTFTFDNQCLTVVVVVVVEGGGVVGSFAPTSHRVLCAWC